MTLTPTLTGELLSRDRKPYTIDCKSLEQAVCLNATLTGATASHRQLQSIAVAVTQHISTLQGIATACVVRPTWRFVAISCTAFNFGCPTVTQWTFKHPF